MPTAATTCVSNARTSALSFEKLNGNLRYQEQGGKDEEKDDDDDEDEDEDDEDDKDEDKDEDEDEDEGSVRCSRCNDGIDGDGGMYNSKPMCAGCITELCNEAAHEDAVLKASSGQ